MKPQKVARKIETKYSLRNKKKKKRRFALIYYVKCRKKQNYAAGDCTVTQSDLMSQDECNSSSNTKFCYYCNNMTFI